MDLLLANKNKLAEEIQNYLTKSNARPSVLTLRKLRLMKSALGIGRVGLVIHEKDWVCDEQTFVFTVELFDDGSVEGDDDSEPYFEVPIQSWLRRVLAQKLNQEPITTST